MRINEAQSLGKRPKEFGLATTSLMFVGHMHTSGSHTFPFLKASFNFILILCISPEFSFNQKNGFL